MKLHDFIPDIADTNNKLVQSNTLLKTMYDNGFQNFVKSSYGDSGMKSDVNYYGLEQLY